MLCIYVEIFNHINIWLGSLPSRIQKVAPGKATCPQSLPFGRQCRHKTLLIDADPQASSAKFANIRDADRPSFVCIELTQPNLHKQLQTLSEPYDYVFIDVGGRDAPVLRSAIGAADTILVPMIPSAADSWAADDIFRILISLAELGVEPDVRVCVQHAVINHHRQGCYRQHQKQDERSADAPA